MVNPISSNRRMYRWIAAFVFALTLLITPSTGASDNGFPVTVTDQFGRTVEIKQKPLRIISCAPGNTEILFALGVGDRVVGVTSFCNYPDEASSKEKVGQINPLDIEKIISLQPDLIVADELNGKETVEKLQKLGFPTPAFRAGSFADIVDSIRVIGRATGATEQAEQVISGIQECISEARASAVGIREKNLKVLFLMEGEPIWTAGPGSFMHEAIELCGGANIAGDGERPWIQIDAEIIVERNPDVILTTMNPEKVYSDPKWQSLAAVSKEQVYRLDADAFSRPAPRLFDHLVILSKLLEDSR